MKTARFFALIHILLMFFAGIPAATSGKTQISDTLYREHITLDPADYAVTQQNLPLWQTQWTVGKVVSGTTYRIWVEFPCFVPLTREEQRMIKDLTSPLDTLHADYTLGISRHEGLLDIRLCPIVMHKGKPARLVQGTLCCAAITPRKVAKDQPGPSSRWSDTSVLKEGKWIKIRVREEGIYAYTPATLYSMGFKDPARVKLYGYGGRPVDENWDFTSAARTPDDLPEIPLYRRSDGTLLFFAEGTLRTQPSTGQHAQNPYSNYSYYFLTEGDSPLEMEQVRATATGDTTPVEAVDYLSVLDNDAAYWYKGGREIYDSHDFAYSNTYTYHVKTPHPASATAMVYVAMSASNKTQSTQVEMQMGGNELGTMSINRYSDAQSGYETRRTWRTQNLEADNAIRITTTQGLSARLNYLKIKYSRQLVATDAPFSFTTGKNGIQTIHIAQANERTQLWAIGDANAPAQRIATELTSDGTLVATVEDGSRRYVFLDAAASYPTPETVGAIEPQNLHADAAADMIIIVPESGKLTTEAERLADFHRSHDQLRVHIVNAAQLYNEFSSGTPDASAYRRYLKMLYDRATDTNDIPSYLLLFGDSYWDNRLITTEARSLRHEDLLLCFPVNEGALGKLDGSFALGELNSYVTDDFFGWLDDNEGDRYSLNKCDLAIGRFLCSDAQTAKVLVDKAIHYGSGKSVGDWKNKIYVLADYGNKNLHMNDAAPVAAGLEEITEGRSIIQRVYWDAYPRVATGTIYQFPTVMAMLGEYMQQGALLFDYSGHGNPTQISYARVLTTEDFKRSSEGRLPLWIMASCEICPFDQLADDIGRTAVTNPAGGAISMICASRSVYSNYNKELNISLTRHLFDRTDNNSKIGMGEALRRAKVEMLYSDGTTSIKDNSMNKLKYVLLGDPVLPLAYATGQIVVDSINGKSVDGRTLERLEAGSIARFSGYVADEVGRIDYNYSGVVSATIADREETIVCHNYDNADKAITYPDRTNIVYEGSDSIRNGRFTIQIRVPRSISYTDDPGRITLYATDSEGKMECHGYNEAFCLNGTASMAEPDTLSPDIRLYVNDAGFVSGDIVAPNPTLYAEIADDYGIATGASTPGSLIELVIDENYAQPISMNSYFSFNFGSYNSGVITYPMTGMTEGTHSAMLRVWDVNGNTSTASISFGITQRDTEAFLLSATQNPARQSTRLICHLGAIEREYDSSITFEVYTINGTRVWRSTPQQVIAGQTGSSVLWHLTDEAGAPLPSGLYLYRVKIARADKGTTESKAHKIIIAK